MYIKNLKKMVRKNNSNGNLCPKSNTSQLNRFNIKFNTNNYYSNNTNNPIINNIPNNNNTNLINQRRQSHSKLTMGKRDRDKENIKEKENESDSYRPGSKANIRQIHIKNRTNFHINNNKKISSSFIKSDQSRGINKSMFTCDFFDMWIPHV